jgi:GT2 family glycosyltransferase
MAEFPEAGLCGSTLLNYRRPHRVDALGGAIYCRWLGLAWHLGRWRNWCQSGNVAAVERSMDYVVGASILVTRRFLEEVGMMDESYFLYYEELDWATRARGRFALAYASESIVYHKVGGSIGTSSCPGKKSLVSDFYTVRNRLKYTRKHHPGALPCIYLGLAVAILVRLLFGQWRRALMVWRLMIDPELSFDEFVSA